MCTSEQPREPQKDPLSAGPKAPLPAKQDICKICIHIAVYCSTSSSDGKKNPEILSQCLIRIDKVGNICLKMFEA